MPAANPNCTCVSASGYRGCRGWTPRRGSARDSADLSAGADLAQETAKAAVGGRGIASRNDETDQQNGFIGGQFARVHPIRNADVAPPLVKDYREKVSSADHTLSASISIHRNSIPASILID
jgi:hypothetical protein